MYPTNLGNYSDESSVILHGITPTYKFNFGREFLCYKECITDLKNINETYLSTDRELILRSVYETPEQAFKIVGIKDIRGWQGFWLGMIVSSIFGILFVLKDFLIAISEKQ